jgi:hypothetical protein
MISRRVCLGAPWALLPALAPAAVRPTAPLLCLYQQGTPALPPGIAAVVDLRHLPAGAWLPLDWAASLRRQSRALLARLDAANHLLLREALRENQASLWHQELRATGNLLFAGWSPQPPAQARLLTDPIIPSPRTP